VSAAIKLSSPATREFWEIPVLFEDEHLLALDKPAGLPVSPDRYDPQRPNLMTLLHTAIAGGKPWARERGLDYLMNAHRLDPEMSGVILLAKNKPALIALANLFGSEKPVKKYTALVSGEPPENQFAVDAKLAPHPVKIGLLCVDAKNGKKSKTQFEVLETFPRAGYTLLKCEPLIGRTHQIRVQLRYAGFPVVGDELYGGKPLWLSRITKSPSSKSPSARAAGFRLPRISCPRWLRASRRQFPCRDMPAGNASPGRRVWPASPAVD
jgi:RluA family pseudouridine synthase